jgi:hypothetical protein
MTMTGFGMRRSPASAASANKPSNDIGARDGKTVQLVCLSLILAVIALALRIASVL